jgi:hypothetical protein
MRFRARQITHRDLILGSEKYPDPDPIMVTWAISHQIVVTPDLNFTVTPPIFFQSCCARNMSNNSPRSNFSDPKKIRIRIRIRVNQGQPTGLLVVSVIKMHPLGPWPSAFSGPRVPPPALIAHCRMRGAPPALTFFLRPRLAFVFIKPAIP